MSPRTRTPPPARERRAPRATRHALLAAAAALFSERGLDGVSVEDIARRAGVNKALISYHFGGKRSLYVAVLESGFSEMADRLAVIEGESKDAREALRRLIRAFATMTRERPDFPVLFVREAVSVGIEPAVIPHLVRVMGTTRRLAERGVREGVFRPVDPFLLHLGLVGTLAFYFGTEQAREKARAEGHLPFALPSTRAFLRHVEEITVRGLAPLPPSRRKDRKGARR